MVEQQSNNKAALTTSRIKQVCGRKKQLG